MLHHFTLTFSAGVDQGLSALAIASRIPGSDFTVEDQGVEVSGEFAVHFSREAESMTDALDSAREQVLEAFPEAQVVAMDVSEEPPVQGMVDDIAKLVLHACKRFGSVDDAQAWLSTPNPELDGLTPKALMVDAEGRLRVSRLLVPLTKKGPL